MRKPMSREHRAILTKNYVQLVDEMQSEFMLPYFIQEGVLLPEMVEEIRTCTTTFMRNEKLLQVLPSRGCKAFNTLLQALRFGAGQMHLVDLLTETTLTAEDLIRGSADSDEYSLSDEAIEMPPVVQLTTTSKIRRKKTGRRKPKVHKENLANVSALFPYIIPHVHGKWRLLASALGLKETDLQDIKEIPHEKKSKYAQNILELWTQKEKNKATKTKLLNALRDINSKRAIEAIAIYDVPKFKAKPISRKPSSSSLPDQNSCDINNSTKTQQPSKQKKLLSGQPLFRETGAMSVKCNVEKIRGVQQTDNVESQTQVTFLTIADRITTSMVDNGDNAKEILNAVERLQGIVFKRVRKGSIILEVQVLHLRALEHLMRLYGSNELTTILEAAFVTKDLLTEFQATEVKLCVHISDSEYEACRDDLLHLTISQTAEASDTEESTTYSQSESEIESEPNDDDDTFLLHLQSEIRRIWNELSSLVREFQPHTTELLMTLKLIQPGCVTRVCTIRELENLRDNLRASKSGNLSDNSISAYLSIHTAFTDKIMEVNSRIQPLCAGSNHQRVCVSELRHISDKLYTVLRMLSPTYDFSSLSHADSAQLTTLETLDYYGLLSYFHTALDLIIDIT